MSCNANEGSWVTICKHVPTLLQPTLLYIFIDSLIWLLLFYHSNFNVCIYNGQYLLFLYSAALYLRSFSQDIARRLKHQIRISNTHIQNRIKHSHRFFSRRFRVCTWRNTRCGRLRCGPTLFSVRWLDFSSTSFYATPFLWLCVCVCSFVRRVWESVLSKCKHYDCIILWQQMEIMGQWKLNQRRRAATPVVV